MVLYNERTKYSSFICCTIYITFLSLCFSDGGIMVSMVAFQAVDPGSIPGHRILLFHQLIIFKQLKLSVKSYKT